ncbi:MAG TPA: extracellular solute-binding protein [Clostridia bacterium]|nr:extracellular solute-binding protein [Clostridia bacterium]
MRKHQTLRIALLLALAMLVTAVLPAALAEAIWNEEGLPIVKDGATYEISILWPARAIAPEPEAVKWIQYAEEQTGVKFTWQKISDAGVAEKINLMLASNDLPDVFASHISRSMVIQYLDQGIFLPTEDLVANYVPNLEVIFADNPVYRAICTAPDGHTYGFPYIEEMYGLVNTPSILYIYKPWLDKLGLDMPQTIEAYVDVLRAFRDNDPNGNGEQDEIPLSASGYGELLNYFKLAYGGASANGGLYLSVLDGKVVSTAIDEAMREDLKLFNLLYEEGLLDPDLFGSSTSGDWRGSIQSKVNNEEVIVGSPYLWIINGDVYDPERQSEYVALPRLQGPVSGIGRRQNNTELHDPLRMVITTACEYPEIVARFVNWCYEPEVSVVLNWGALDYVYVKGEDGILHWDTNENGLPNLKDGYNSIDEMRFVSSPVTLAEAIRSSYYGTVCDYPTDAKRILDDQILQGKNEVIAENEFLPPMWMLPEENERLAQISGNITNEISFGLQSFVLDGGIDDGWDGYVKSVNDAGLEELLSIYQGAYDRYVQNMK